jgi:hypothetical protein
MVLEVTAKYHLWAQTLFHTAAIWQSMNYKAAG